MRQYSVFATRGQYAVALLDILAGMPGGQGSRREVMAEFERRFHRLIPASGFASLSAGQGIRWVKELDWSRRLLYQMRFLDETPPGVWRISQAGRRWLDENPSATTMALIEPDSSERARLNAKRTRSECDTRRHVPRQRRDQEERLVAVLRREVAYARGVLRGHVPRPTDERLCDLVLFCYTLELYEEANALFALVDRAGVNSWQYDRSRKLALVSAQRTASARAEGSHRR